MAARASLRAATAREGRCRLGPAPGRAHRGPVDRARAHSPHRGARARRGWLPALLQAMMHAPAGTAERPDGTAVIPDGQVLGHDGAGTITCPVLNHNPSYVGLNGNGANTGLGCSLVGADSWLVRTRS